MLALGQAVDDAQYGFRSIVNNIPQMVYMMGGGAGLAGAVGIAAVAINQLINHFGELSDLLQTSWAGGSIEQLTMLREKAEEATKAFEKLAETPTKAKAAAGKGFGELVTEGPTDKILKDVAEAITGDKGNLKTNPKLPEPNAIVDWVAEQLGIPKVSDIPGAAAQKGLAKQAEKEAREADLQKAKELLGAASQGDPNAMLTLQGLVKRHPGAFPDEFMQNIKDQTPEGQKRIEQQRLEAKGERNARKIDQDFEIKQQKKAKQDRIQGLEDEREQIQKAQRDFDEQMWQKQHAATQQQGQMFSGAKSFIDYYHGANTGGDDPKALAKQAHEQRKKTNDLLEDIDKQMKKERRLVVPT